jgi:hypothetical protein
VDNLAIIICVRSWNFYLAQCEMFHVLCIKIDPSRLTRSASILQP